MNKETIIKELTEILNEDFSSMKLLGRTSSFRCNKDLFLKLKNKYPNILKSIKHLVEIAKHRNNFDECLGLFYCQCGNEKVITSKFCSNHNCPAKNKSVGINCKKTKLERYGDANYNNEDKHKQTCLERYGVDNIRKSEKFKEHSKKVKLERYGDEKFTNREKAKQTCLEKYGKSNYMQTDEFRDKSKKYFQENYNKDYFFETEEFQEKRKETCMSRYGYDSFSKTNEFINKIKETNMKNLGVEHPAQSNHIIQKMKSTNTERYGVDSFSKTKKFKNLFNDKNFVKNIKLKEYETKKKNNSFNTSIPENEIFELLKQKFSDVIHLYSYDERYPFQCDFYIKSLDLFIEYNGHWTHGSEPFDKTNPNHLQTLESLINKSKKLKDQGKLKNMYDTAIFVWTDLDVRKLNIARKNKLNFIMFYTFEKFLEWFEEQ